MMTRSMMMIYKIDDDDDDLCNSNIIYKSNYAYIIYKIDDDDDDDRQDR